jgi:molybdate transport system regulatory protein
MPPRRNAVKATTLPASFGYFHRMSVSQLRFRILLKPGFALGPGKIDLLAGIAETGSISAAGRRMGMSYKKAWRLIDEMNGAFRRPLVAAAKGGKAGGGASLTPTGRAVLDRYRAMEIRAARLYGQELRDLDRLVARPRQGRQR